jgi:hypothetical protein
MREPRTNISNQHEPQTRAQSDEPFHAVLQKSGNSFHCRVANAFRSEGWTVLLSPYYVDNATDKAREVDLVCEKCWSVPHQFDSRAPPREFRIQLVVECKYVPSDSATVLWFDDRNDGLVRKNIKDLLPFFESATDFAQQHYNAGVDRSVAKTFQSRGAANEDREPLFVALSQCIGALLGPLPTLTEQENSRTNERRHSVRYGVVVCSTFERFRRADVGGAGELREIAANFQFEMNYAWRNITGATVRTYALVDVVSWANLKQFLCCIDTEVEAVKLRFADTTERGWTELI